jgi:hypothetical protein
MTNLHQTPARLRLDAALDNLAAIFRGMTAHPDENNCECHWGSAEDLARLKVPDLELDPDLLRRTWQAPDWNDHGSVLRRILPQLAAGLTSGRVEPVLGMEDVGRSFARGRWQQWPAQQAAAVREFLHAWWAHSLTTPDASVPAHEVLALCAVASGTLNPWLASWEAQTGPVADRHLAEAVAHWEFYLLTDELPWDWDAWSWEWSCPIEEDMRAVLTAWLVRHAPTRLRAHGAPDQLLHRVRLLSLTGPARWDDPHWPYHS